MRKMQKGMGNPAESAHFHQPSQQSQTTHFPTSHWPEQRLTATPSVSGGWAVCTYFLGLAKRQGSVTKRKGEMGFGRELVVSAMENERNSALDSSV